MNEKPESVRAGGPPRQVIAGVEDRPKKKEPLPVWFFVGIILVIYGVMIFVTGLTEISHPPDTVLAQLHAAIWWGAIIAALGAVFIYTAGPWRSQG
jgi:FtsH-binding integral membrane protein